MSAEYNGSSPIGWNHVMRGKRFWRAILAVTGLAAISLGIMGCEGPDEEDHPYSPLPGNDDDGNVNTDEKMNGIPNVLCVRG